MILLLAYQALLTKTTVFKKTVVFCGLKKRAGKIRLLKVKALSLFVKLRGNFGGKVFVFFLQAFTEFEANVIS